MIRAFTIEVFCDFCDEGIPAPGGSFYWTAEDVINLRKHKGGRARCACGKDTRVHGKIVDSLLESSGGTP